MNGHKAKQLRRVIYGDYSPKERSTKRGIFLRRLYQRAKVDPKAAIKWGQQHVDFNERFEAGNLSGNQRALHQ